MPIKTDASNLGMPVFVDPANDLAAKPGTITDSWYVLFNFNAGGREIGFEWHQANFEAGPAGKVAATEFLLMDASNRIWLDHAAQDPIGGEIGAATDALRVTSSFGTLAGDPERITLQLSAEDGAVDLVMRPRRQVLCNGTIGLLPLWGSLSYQFSFPNMEIQGTVRLRDETFDVKGTTAWLDRQWTYPKPDASAEGFLAGLPSWLWIGMALNEDATAAISLWDVCYKDGRRHAFATVLDADGNQTNHIADLIYGDIWTSERSGNSYPASIKVSIPTANLELTISALLERPEFSHGGESGGANIDGCQSPCRVQGHYGDLAINRVAIVEMIGDVCGSN